MHATANATTVWILVVGVSALVLGSPFLLKALFRALDRWRHPPFADDCCAACGAFDLDTQAPGVYRCRACGYEGGENRGAFEAKQRQVSWADRPWTERVAAARQAVADARYQLEAQVGPDGGLMRGSVVPSVSLGAVSAGVYESVSQAEIDRVEDNLHMAVSEALLPLQRVAEILPGIALPTADDPVFSGSPENIHAALVRLTKDVAVQVETVAASYVEAG